MVAKSSFNPRLSSNFQTVLRNGQSLLSNIIRGDGEKKFNLDIPFEQISVFARRYETSEALQGVSMFAVAELGLLDEPEKSEPPSTDDLNTRFKRDQEFENTDGTGPIFEPVFQNDEPKLEWRPRVRVPLGMLSTDHTGYVSFDLGVLRSESVVRAIRQVKETPVPTKPAPPQVMPRRLKLPLGDVEVIGPRDVNGPRIGLKHLWILPFADDNLQVDAMLRADIGPTYLVLRIELDESRMQDRLFKATGMPSMQNPGILDYNISPGSFSISPGVTFGGDGSCESLMPSNLSSQTFRFYQLARAGGKVLSTPGSEEWKIPAGLYKFRFGHIFEYTTEFFPIGHSLGTLSYSLPLAPGEMVKLAIVDWSREDNAARGEDTSFGESLRHSQIRDRSLTEVVNAALDEWQRGGSVMGGVAASGSYGGSGYSLGGAAAIGGGYSTSSGTRDLSATTTQQIADGFQQGSSAMRELRSTIVVQSDQQEQSKVQTRIVANYNHGHALTMLYYEVLRHYRVVTRLANVRPALLIDESQYGLAPNVRNRQFLLKFRAQLEVILIDQSLKPLFDVVARNYASEAKYNRERSAFDDPNTTKPRAESDIEFTSFVFDYHTGPHDKSIPKFGGTDGKVYLNLITTTSNEVHTYQRMPAQPKSVGKDQRWLETEGDPFEKNQPGWFLVVPSIQRVKWGDLIGFVLNLNTEGDSDEWGLDYLKLTGQTDSREQFVLYDSAFPGNVFPGMPEKFWTKAATKPKEPNVTDYLKPEDVEAESRLLDHLEANKFAYARHIWLNENVNERAARFDGVVVPELNLELLDIIDNKAVEMAGRWVAYPLAVPQGPELRRVLKYFDIDDSNEATPGDQYLEQLISLPTRGVFAEAKLGHCNANEVIDDTRFWDWQKSPIPYQAPEITGADAGSRYQVPQGLTPTQFPQPIVNIVNPQALPDPTGMSKALDVMSAKDIFRDSSLGKEVGTLLGKLSDNATAMAAGAQKGADRKALMDDINKSTLLSPEQKQKLTNDLLAKEVADMNKPAEKPTDGQQGAQPPKTGAPGTAPTGTGTQPTNTTPQQPGTQTPATPSTGTAAPGAPGANTKPATPSTAETTKPWTKPQVPTAIPKKGLNFMFFFQNPRVNTVAVGKATVGIRGAVYRNSGSDQFSSGFIGPLDIKDYPEMFLDKQFVDGSVWLATEQVNGPGNLTVKATYTFDLWNQGSMIEEIEVMLKNKGQRPIFEKQVVQATRTFTGGKPFVPTKEGDVLMYTITPEFETVTVEFEDEGHVGTEFSLGGKIGAKDVVEFEPHWAFHENSPGKSKVSVAFKYLKQGLTFEKFTP